MASNVFNSYLSTPVAITQKALNAALDIEERQRKEAAQLNKDFYYGKQEQLLVLMNEDVDPVILNLTKPIMDKRCGLLYQRPLVRIFDGPAESTLHLEQLYKDNSFDTIMRAVDLLAELTGSVLLHPYIDKSMPSGFRIRIYDATQFSAVGNDGDPDTADAISLVRVVDRLYDGGRLGQDNSIRSERVLVQQIWTPESVVFYEGNVLKQSESNPLGFLPFVNIKGEEIHDEFIGYAGANNIRKLNANINQLLTHLNHMIKMQSGTPIAFTGLQTGETITMHPGRAVNLPAGASAFVLGTDPKIEATLQTIQYLEDRLFSSTGVPKITIEGGDGDKTHISGDSLIVRWYPLMQVFNEKTTRYERYELAIANMMLAVAGLPPVDAVEVRWAEESILPYMPEDQGFERDLRFGLTNPIDEIQRRNPSLTDEEAEVIWRTNLELNTGLNQEQVVVDNGEPNVG